MNLALTLSILGYLAAAQMERPDGTPFAIASLASDLAMGDLRWQAYDAIKRAMRDL